MLQINEVVLYGETRYRILHSTDEGIIWINIDSDRSIPEQISVAEVEEAILAEALKRVDDPFWHLAAQLPEQGSVSQQIRDKRLAVIEPLTDNQEIYRRRGRGALVQQ